MGPIFFEADRLDTLTSLESWDFVADAERLLAVVEADDSDLGVYARLIALRYIGAALMQGTRRDYARSADAFARLRGLAHRIYGPMAEQSLAVMSAHAHTLARRFGEAAAEYNRAIDLLREVGGDVEKENNIAVHRAHVLSQVPEIGRLSDMAGEYHRVGDRELEAHCRLALANALGNAGGHAAERIEEYRHAARLFEWLAQPGYAGHSLHGALRVTALRRYRDGAGAGDSDSADRLAAQAARLLGAARWWAERGDVERLAAHQLRSATPVRAAPDPRVAPAFLAAAGSFTQGNRPLDAAECRLLAAGVLAEIDLAGEWELVAVSAMHGFDDARPSLLLPAEREMADERFSQPLLVVKHHLVQMLRFGVDIVARPQALELAWWAEQATKGRTFLDQLAQEGIWNHLVAGDQRLRDLVRELEATSIQVREIADQPALYSERVAYEERLGRLERQVLQRARDLIKQRPAVAGLAGVPMATVAEAQAVLQPGEAYLGYIFVGGPVVRLLLTDSDLVVSLCRHGFHDFARQAARTVRSAGADLPSLRPSLAADLIGPLPSGTRTLIISPDRLLVGVPWHLLPTPGAGTRRALLGDRYKVAVVPAIGTLCHLRRGRGEAASKPSAAYLGVACEKAAGLPSLHWAEKEVALVMDSYFAAEPGSRALVTSNCHRFLSEGCDVRLLHLACHAGPGGLYISPDGTVTTPVDLLNDDGRRFRAGILLLTGCDAGRFSDNDNNEFVGVVRQLLASTSAAAAVVSMAPVPDQAGPVFADLVVRALAGRGPDRPWPTPKEALPVGAAVAWARSAMRKLSSADVRAVTGIGAPAIARPGAWAPWCVIGDPASRF